MSVGCVGCRCCSLSVVLRAIFTARHTRCWCRCRCCSVCARLMDMVCIETLRNWTHQTEHIVLFLHRRLVGWFVVLTFREESTQKTNREKNLLASLGCGYFRFVSHLKLDNRNGVFAKLKNCNSEVASQLVTFSFPSHCVRKP